VKKSYNKVQAIIKSLHIKHPLLDYLSLLMNVKQIAKHFPELAEMEPAERQALLTQAYQNAFSAEHKMKIWRNNLISALIMASLCFFFVLVLRPALGMSQQTSAIILMLIAFPAYFFIQQRRFIKQLRSSLQKLLP
jgi:small neutral amino acid transporter SnatA (MarC family)